MKFGFKHVAVAAVLAFGAISTPPVTVQAQNVPQVELAPEIQELVNQALAAGDEAAVLAALNTVMANNPSVAGAIAAVAAAPGTGRPELAASIGATMAAVVNAATTLTTEQKAAQIQTGSQALAAANQDAAAATIAAIAAAAPAFQQVAIDGGVQGAPTQAAAIVQAGTTAGGQQGGDQGGNQQGGNQQGQGGDQDGGDQGGSSENQLNPTPTS